MSVYMLKIVPPDKILCYINTLIIIVAIIKDLSRLR